MFTETFNATTFFITHFCEQVWYFLSWMLETIVFIFQSIAWCICEITYGIFEWVIPCTVAIVLFFVGIGLIFGVLFGFVELLGFAAKKYASSVRDARDRENFQEAKIDFYA
ncbi:uncharacterized protein N7473_007261 [Penicillium subrubescens]|uniref:uncharacterized protein n=1 Tax=Penicillium subrubescens TaxID=1316194 RepID=UPI0025450215|nr:uncharacterized protein N7473_007261 [Penicillium subrubescens]KAJ5891033.1 hypothetical protein N7473_007261 [Penicillium subrubescens]